MGFVFFWLTHTLSFFFGDEDPTAFTLQYVPGGDKGPGGLLVGAINNIYYVPSPESPAFVQMLQAAQQHQLTVGLRCPVPQRYSFDQTDDTGVLVQRFALVQSRAMFFFFAQTELGDVYRVSLEMDKVGDDKFDAKDISCKYYDTLPPTISMQITRNGFLFAACEDGDHLLLRVLDIGEDDDTASCSARATALAAAESKILEIPRFVLRQLQNLEIADRLANDAPIVDLKVLDLSREAQSQIYAVRCCGVLFFSLTFFPRFFHSLPDDRAVPH